MKPSEKEINDVLNKCAESEETGESRWPGMTFEQGVKAAIEWMQGEGENQLVDGVLTLIDEETTQRDGRPITERVKTFEDACKVLGDEHPLVSLYNVFENEIESTKNADQEKDVLAYLKLRIIAAALNLGWEPQFTEDEYRWYPWFTLWTKEELADESEEGKKELSLWLFGGRSSYGAHCGLAFAVSSRVWSDSYSSVSARLAVKSEELAVYFGKQFIGIWADYVGPFNRQDAEV